MIPDITEVNFPSYATLHQASVSFSDMGDRTITTQVKIDGDIAPEFIGTNGEDWEVTFKGERFIHPLRKPQATKNNESRYSLIDMTFYHWAEYQMKRYYFVSLASINAGTAIADKYVVSMNLDLESFARAINDVLEYYFPDGELYVYKTGDSYIYPNLQDYDTQVKAVEISYTYIWELLQKTQELYKCRWTIEKDGNDNYAIKFGYPVTELSHIFKYGYDGGLLRLERQVQDANIRNQILGRGGEKNLPRLYFKDYEKFHPNSTDSAYSNYGQIPDPDAIPELENIYFSELRDSNFRSYVQGWKTNPHRQLTTPDGWVGTVETYDASRGATDWAYKKGHEDETFDPVEYVKDDASIATYGLLQGGLENQEDIYPSIQGMKIEVPCVRGAHDSLVAGHDVETLADELVSAEPVLTDEISASQAQETIKKSMETSSSTSNYWPFPAYSTYDDYWSVSGTTFNKTSYQFFVPQGFVAYADEAPLPVTTLTFSRDSASVQGGSADITGEKVTIDVSKNCTLTQWYYMDSSGNRVRSKSLPSGRYTVVAEWKAPSVKIYKRYSSRQSNTGYRYATHIGNVTWHASFGLNLNLVSFDGTVVANTSATASHTIAASQKYEFSLQGDQFTVGADGALMVEVPISVLPEEYALVESQIHVINASTSQEVSNQNIPAGTYRLFVDVTVRNLDSSESHSFTAGLGDTYIYNLHQQPQWQPTFDVWIKNIFNTDRSEFDGGSAGDDQYVASVWEPLRTTEDMAVTFTTGNLSYSSDWEFKIASGGIHYDNSKIIRVEDEDGLLHDVRSEWRLTLIKSEAESDAIHKYIPYKDYNAVAGDRYFLTGIYLPWAYVYAAEQELTEKKQDELDTTKEVLPTWVVGLDKIRINTLAGAESAKLIDSIHAGDLVRVKDDRFTEQNGVLLYVTSITYSWPGEGEIIPEVEIVLSDKLITSMSVVQQIQQDVQVISNEVKGVSNLERTIRKIGDAAYLRKDGIFEESYSPTSFQREIRSANFQQGMVGGEGWSAYTDGEGKAVLEADRLIVREQMKVNDLVVNQVSTISGTEILSAAAMVVSRVDIVNNGYKCYFDQRSGSLQNHFIVGDIAMAQEYSADNTISRWYKSVVLAVGDDYIVLSNDPSESVGSATPQEGDSLVQYGHTSDASRQFVIIRDVIGGGYEQMLSGLVLPTDTGNEYYFAGTKAVSNQLVPRWFVGNASGEFAKWEGGELSVKGRITVLSENGDVVMGPSTVITGGAVLSSLIGVVDSSSVLQAGINALDDYDDTTHGTLMIFAGSNGEAVADITGAPFRVYEDGTVYSSKLVAEAGCTIGAFSIMNDTLIGTSVFYGSHRDDDTWANHINVAFFPSQLNFNVYTSSNTNIGGILIGSSLSAVSIADSALLDIKWSRAKTQAGGSEHVNRGINCSITGTNMEGEGAYLYCHATGYANYGARIDVGGATNNIGVQITSTGDAIRAVNGMYAGFRPNIVTKNTSNTPSNPYSDLDNIIICANSSSITHYLPSSPKKGQMYIVHHTTTSSLTINGNGKNLARAYGDGTTSTTSSVNVRQTVWLFYDGSKWVINYLSH